MDEFFKRLSEGAADATSRRGFLARVAKATAVVAATVAGLGLGAGTALASPLCCSACRNTTCSTGYSCPSGTTANYRWTCCYGGYYYECVDCYNSSGTCVCTYDFPLKYKC